MKSFVKQFLILLGTFLIILWVQNNDDLKNNVQRKSLYDKYKIPFLSTAFVGLVINYLIPECSISIIDIADDFGFNINHKEMMPISDNINQSPQISIIREISKPNPPILNNNLSIKNLLDPINIINEKPNTNSFFNKTPEVFLDQPDF